MVPADETVGHLVSRIAEELGQQAELHIELVKAEIARDAKTLGRDAKALGKDLAPLALAVPLLGLGYLFTCVAVALALAPLITAAGGLAVVGMLNLLGGGVVGYRSLSRLRTRRILHAPVGATVASELGRSARSIVTALSPSSDNAELTNVR